MYDARLYEKGYFGCNISSDYQFENHDLPICQSLHLCVSRPFDEY